MILLLGINVLLFIKRILKKLILISLLLPLLTGCVKLITQFSPNLIPNLTQTFFEECDSELARVSLPADLKLLEGLLKNDPQNKQLLTALCMGFTGYSALFLEEKDPERASLFYLRARNYGLKALGCGVVTNLQLEMIRVIMARALRKGGKFWIRVFSDKPVTKKPAETRMGKGKGDVDHWGVTIKRGKVLFEIAGIPREYAQSILRNQLYLIFTFFCYRAGNLPCR